ncbi:MAG: RagB/SusD family nutrient uptake outer membrane protein [Bacteroidales bacterium]|nr:RagB/SusD family nutrient uptake outer membrane protein [Bacteroidales bacterium]
MKTLKYILGALVLAAGMSSCVGDLNVTPLDPALNTADKALQTEDDYFALLAQCYTGFATSGFKGPNGDNAISGVDGGFSQYYRGRYHLNGLTTDEAVCGWNDQTLQDLHGLNWTTSDVFVAAFYYRIAYQISACNEFIRQADKATIDLPKKDQWIAEARALRALCWLDAIDNYGGFPFADETNSVGSTAPEYRDRKALCEYLENECKELLDGSALYDYGQGEYGRVNKGMVAMVLAKLYLNSEVYTGTARYADCAAVLKNLEGKYKLHTNVHGTGANAYQELFLADNDRCTDELIFVVEQNGTQTASYGATNYLIFASTGDTMDPAAVGISSGWGGIRTTPEFYGMFDAADQRELFWEEGHTLSIDDISTFSNGIGFQKFKNVNSDGSAASDKGFVDVDFPVFRYADALLMLAECELNGVSCGGKAAFDAVRARAGMPAIELNAENLLQERGRELYLEGWRRSDLVRFGKFTSDSFVWQWKGGVKDGQGCPAHMAIFPIPDSDRYANPNLVQNDGYGA